MLLVVLLFCLVIVVLLLLNILVIFVLLCDPVLFFLLRVLLHTDCCVFVSCHCSPPVAVAMVTKEEEELFCSLLTVLVSFR